MKTGNNKVLIAVILMLWLDRSQTCVWGQQFEVSGTISHHIFVGNSNYVARGKQANMTNAFFVAVDGCNYRIQVKTQATNIYETTFDGSFLYQLISMNQGSNFHHTGILESGHIPPDDGTTMNYLWLAYASSCYLDNLKTNRLVPIWMLDDPSLREEGFTVKGFWDKSPGGPPRNVVFLNDGFIRVATERTNRLTIPFPPPFDGGFTNAEYHALSTTNIGDLTIPTSFAFTRYYVQNGRLFARTVTQAKAETVKTGAHSTGFHPEFSGVALTVDKRFRAAEKPLRFVHYHVTNGNWLGMDALAELHEKQFHKHNVMEKARKAEDRRRSPRAFWIRASLLAMMLLPVIVFVLKKNKKHISS